jgi:2-polyprenyl-3-methyl-5-hydroxy-6-metoxy-1,4-benzoquinol methylase
VYEFKWIAGHAVTPQQRDEMATLYSANYGIWGPRGRQPGAHIKLSGKLLQDWLAPQDSRVAMATESGKIVGYAIAVQTAMAGRGMVSWVTQLVVDEAHRQKSVAKKLLFTIWQFSDHFAWGLLTANPYAVRALEKATRRRCIPARIRTDHAALLALGAEIAPYVRRSTETNVTASESRINTEFYLDHSQLSEMLLRVAGPDRPWQLGPLEEGWEWFAFTFHDQKPISLDREELEQMLLTSDEVTKQAYSRISEVLQNRPQPWTKYTSAEVTFIKEVCSIRPGDSVLDFGCGNGRHALALAKEGARIIGVDYVESAINKAKKESVSVSNVEFIQADCRYIELLQTFDAAICLYDVVGSYADNESNLLILQNLASHLKPGACVLLSVMNFELTERLCKNSFSITAEPDQLLSLQPGKIMEKTGDVFDPHFYLVDRETEIVYRKEQFIEGESLPTELLIRDRRFRPTQIQELCKQAGLEVLWFRYVHAGGWRDPLASNDDRAKEILVMCRKPQLPMPTLFAE